MSSSLDTPWKIINESRRLLGFPFIYIYFLFCGVAWKKGWRVYGCPIIQRHAKSRIEIGSGFNMRNFKASNPLGPYRQGILSTRKENSVIRLGRNVGITGGTICAAERIEIGDRVFIGANCTIADTDFHPLDAAKRNNGPSAGKSAPIIIEEDVFIGMNSIILKGVRIGKGAVIGAGSVVTKDIPERVVAAGNPAKVIRELK